MVIFGLPIVVATNIRITCTQAGADGLFDGPGDDVYMHWTTSFSGGGGTSLKKIIRVQGTNFSRDGMFAGEVAQPYEIFASAGSYNVASDVLGSGVFGIGTQGSVTFKLIDSDGSLFDIDDLLLKTTYQSTGKEPLFGAGAFYFVNFSDQNGSKYKLEYNINQFPTKGKVASAQSGVMNGRNTAGTMVGLNGKDTINGNNGDDLILGGGNSDIVNGGNGNDVVFGGKGIDCLKGGKGKDTFVVARSSRLDTIKDFRVGKDQIGLANALTFQNLSFVKGSGGTLIKTGRESLAQLQGIQPNQLSASSFVQSDLVSINSLVNANLETIKAS